MPIGQWAAIDDGDATQRVDNVLKSAEVDQRVVVNLNAEIVDNSVLQSGDTGIGGCADALHLPPGICT